MLTNRVVIISETCCDLSPAEAQYLGIVLVPDIVRLGEEEFDDVFEISASEFYSRMKSMKELPTSSHPSLGSLLKALDKAKENGASEILCIPVTAKMSGGYDAFLAAAGIFMRRNPDITVSVYDSGMCSHGMGITVRTAALAAQQGRTVSEIIPELDEYKSRIGFVFMLDSLQNARKGGRVGAIKAFAADAMGLKPLLCFEDGVCRDFGIAPGADAGYRRLAEMLSKDADLKYPVTVFHAASVTAADKLKGEILKLCPDAIITEAYVGPVIGIYAGIGAAGIAYTKRAVL